MYMYMYMYMYVYMYVYINIYIYIYTHIHFGRMGSALVGGSWVATDKVTVAITYIRGLITPFFLPMDLQVSYLVFERSPLTLGPGHKLQGEPESPVLKV